MVYYGTNVLQLALVILFIFVSIFFFLLLALSIFTANKQSKTEPINNDTKLKIPLEKEMTYNSLMVYKFLYNNKNSWHSHREIAEKLNISVASVVGAVTGLTKKNYAYRKKVNKISMVTISEEGINHYTWSKSGL